MVIKYHGWDGVVWINLAQYIVKLQAFGNTLVNTLFHKTWGIVLQLLAKLNEEVNVDIVWTVSKSVYNIQSDTKKGKFEKPNKN